MAFEWEASPFASDEDKVSSAPTIFVDAVIGSATANGVARLTFGTFKHNMHPNAEYPKLVPSLTLMIPEDSLNRLVEELKGRADWVKTLTPEAASD